MSEKDKTPVTLSDRLRSLESKSVLTRLGQGDLFDRLVQSWDHAAGIDSQLKSCVYFNVTDASALEQLVRRSREMEAEWFWQQLSQLFIIISRSSSRAIQRLVEVTLMAIEQKNELALALAARAVIEHCGAITWLRARVLDKSTERIRGTVWPQLEEPVSLQPLDSDRILLKDLVRFALGTRAIEDSRAGRPVDMGAKSWKEYRKKVETVPDEVKAEQVMNYLDELCEQPGCQDFRLSHALLSEYCHPNSASRMFDFAAQMKSGIPRVMSMTTDSEFSPGFLNVLNICCETIPRACEQISIALDGLFACCHPQASIVPESENELPAPGATGAVNTLTGQILWIDSSKISRRDAPLGELTPDQERRATAIAAVLADPIGMSRDEWIRLLRMNVNIEFELRISEIMAHVYSQEMVDRPNAENVESSLVYEAILHGLECRTYDELLSVMPSLKSLRGSKRLFSRLKEIQ